VGSHIKFCKNLFRTVFGIFSEFITVVLKKEIKEPVAIHSHGSQSN